MKLNKNTFIAAAFIVLGILMLLGKLGFGVGWLMSYVVPIAMVFLGYIGLRNGKTVIGTFILAIGLIVLLGKLAGVLWFLVPIVLIGIGFTMLNPRRGIH
ncbi:LiaF transmembrane domain-containing protein [Paenibacillus turpanensis]|uniref:LiaF transmembrane domain-containing protein n=1 Tax=Paenibacillus turpanensis TaxID=2689078 RepID=UPI00140AB3E6|nr:hypothetical protein [Paenibacillus turpanensis]